VSFGFWDPPGGCCEVSLYIASFVRPISYPSTTSSKFSVPVADLSCHLPFFSFHLTAVAVAAIQVAYLARLRFGPRPRDTSDDKGQSVRRSRLALSKTLPTQKSRLLRSDRHPLLSSVILELHFSEGETCPCPPSCFRSIIRPLPFGLRNRG